MKINKNLLKIFLTFALIPTQFILDLKAEAYKVTEESQRITFIPLLLMSGSRILVSEKLSSIGKRASRQKKSDYSPSHMYSKSKNKKKIYYLDKNLILKKKGVGEANNLKLFKKNTTFTRNRGSLFDM